MNIIVCIDDNNGMMFNHRRQSQDRILRERILDDIRPEKLWMNRYSAGQFADHPDQIRVDEEFLEKAGETDFCFVEDQKAGQYAAKIGRIILCRWNRAYPADQYFDLDMREWRMIRSSELAGSSHEKIVMEEYIK